MKTILNQQHSINLFAMLTLATAAFCNVCRGQPMNRVAALTNTAYVGIPSAAALQPSSAITIEAWVNPFSVAAVLSKSDGIGVATDRSYELGAGGNAVGASLFLGANVWAGCQATNIASFNNKWTHMAVTFSSAEGTIRLYVNGILAAQATTDWGGTIPLTGLTVRQSSQPLILGYNSIVGSPASLLLDEVRIWNVVRTDSEIQQNMSSKLTGNEPGLAGYWNFDLGTAADGTANHFDGTFYNGATTITDNIPVAVQISVASVAISFPTGSPLTTYQVQYSTNVAATNWINLGSPLPGNGAVQSVMDSVYGEPKKFYRVVFY
ncbi:MAG: LamG domain-containing protein [Verrucomicrobia bacterium]|nr:LamG domain-containing protein [Verrucomicrobiota bacterium]